MRCDSILICVQYAFDTLAGGSSGSAMAAALQVAKKMKAGQRVVVVLPGEFFSEGLITT